MIPPDYDRVIEEVFSVPHVRYATVINETGEKLAGGMRPGVTSVSPVDEERRLELSSILALRMAQGYEKHAGRLQYLFFRWTGIIAFFALLSDKRGLCVTLEGNANQSSMDRINQIAIKFRGNTE